MEYELSLHIFRRDLRLHDNTALMQALSSSKQVIPCFIFDKRQIDNNPYKSDNCIQFMLKSLHELNERLKEKNSRLYFFYGLAEEIIEQLITQNKTIKAIYLNHDYTPFSLERDNKIKILCQNLGLDFHCHADALLQEPEEIYKLDKSPYTVFTPFYHKAVSFAVANPKKNSFDNYYQANISLEDKFIFKKLSSKNNINLYVKGGREEAISLLKKSSLLKNYDEIRNFPALNGTTKLSAHNKFGTVSIREVYAVIEKQLGRQHTLIKELYWRDFFTHIAFHFPHVIGNAFHKKYNSIEWSKNEKYFLAWCKGETGFPIVDAGMRELNTSGFMHNRVRMITASFLVKDLHIDWRWGERYFAQHLVDYDASVNNGNWQWAASTGCDAQPYFRIFNPWLQQEKFDADCLYIKKWIPELAKIPAKTIHQLAKENKTLMTNYPKPIIDHAVESQKTKLLYNPG